MAQRKREQVRHSLLKRALQYVAFALAVAGFVGGLSSFTEMMQGLIFVAEAPNGTVLSFYALAPLACLALIPLRLRIGTIQTWSSQSCESRRRRLGIGRELLTTLPSP